MAGKAADTRSSDLMSSCAEAIYILVLWSIAPLFGTVALLGILRRPCQISKITSLQRPRMERQTH